MIFYRRLQSVAAISFDLDDTLYANSPNMINAERKMLAYFSQHFPETAREGEQACRYYWHQFRAQALALDETLIDDVTALRLTSYYLAIKALGVNDAKAHLQAQKALAYFIEQRSDFEIPEQSRQLLTLLGQFFPLVAITNGNVDFAKLGLNDYFQAIYHPGKGVKRKPNIDMFTQACQKLAITPRQLLHVGDCGHADIYGALQAGCQTAWLNRYGVGKAIKVLPHIELADIKELALLTYTRT
jgi:putative hydrolase of the HAD superfamily